MSKPKQYIAINFKYGSDEIPAIYCNDDIWVNIHGISYITSLKSEVISSTIENSDESDLPLSFLTGMDGGPFFNTQSILNIASSNNSTEGVKYSRFVKRYLKELKIDLFMKGIKVEGRVNDVFGAALSKLFKK